MKFDLTDIGLARQKVERLSLDANRANQRYHAAREAVEASLLALNGLTLNDEIAVNDEIFDRASEAADNRNDDDNWRDSWAKAPYARLEGISLIGDTITCELSLSGQYDHITVWDVPLELVVRMKAQYAGENP